ncbi:MAG: hypothetical protein ACRDZ8_01590 [Acidimicrobiales bacterium]
MAAQAEAGPVARHPEVPGDQGPTRPPTATGRRDVAERAAAIGARRRSRLRSTGAGDDDGSPITFTRPAPGQPLFPDLASSVSKLVAQPEAKEDRKKKPTVKDAVDYFRLIKKPGDEETPDSTT